MNVLIVSDNPERKLFRQILKLKNDIGKIINGQVDLITLSSSGIFLNQKLIMEKTGGILNSLEPLLRGKVYSTFIVSLESKHLRQLFLNKYNILNLIARTSPKAAVFIFGANRILKTIKQSEQVSLHPRRGVAKLTKKLKKQIITYIQSKRLF
jgi:hypothetical protein